MIGTKVRHYLIEEKLSESGMGQVYRAKDEKLDREVALKFLHSRLVNQPFAVARFIREAKAASRLNHPNIVSIYDTGEDEKAGRFIVMEFVEGRTLRADIGKKIKLDKLLHIVTQITEALIAAHGAGVIHRDIKPENIMVRKDDYVKVVDFGLARWEPTTGDNDAPVTRTAPGTVLGTLRYMSPEQASGQRVEAATDIFSLGVVLYELVTGRHPFEARGDFETRDAIRYRPVLPPRRWVPQIPQALEVLILRMLERNSRKRVTAQQVADQLARIDGSGYTTGSIPAAPPRQPLVGRHRERVQLRAIFESTLEDSGLMVLIAGEPGIGKTTLVENFLDELKTSHRGCAIGGGRCSERMAGTEAYLPFLEALDDLIRGTASIAQLMKRLAPNWYTRVARDTAGHTVNISPGRLKPTSRELLNRELGTFLEEASKNVPLVLFFDDLHWADDSTIDLLTWLATRFDSTRILILASYRPEEALLKNPRFIQIARDLESHRRCRNIELDFLSVADVDAYLTLEFPQNNFPPAFPRLIHAKTEGTPFFMVEVVRYLRDKQFISEVAGMWTLSEKLPDIERDLPQSVVVMIQRKIDFVSDIDRQLLAAASVQGYEFDSPVVARLLKRQTAYVEERLDKLQRVHGLVQALVVNELPSGTRASHYRFVHILYYRSFYDAIQPARKEQWSAAAAQALVEFYRDHVDDISAQIAFLFEAAHDYPRAARYFSLAAQNAGKLFAYPEAVLLARRGLLRLKADPDKPPEPLDELILQRALAVPLGNVKGYGNLEAQQAYNRARELSAQVGQSPLVFPPLWGLLAYYASRLELPAAIDISEQFMRLARNSQDPTHLLGAHLAIGIAKFFRGDLESALEHLGKFREKRFRVLDDHAARVATAQDYGLEFGIVMRGFRARVLWYLGYPDKCVKALRETLSPARALSHAPTLALVSSLAGLTHQMRGEVNEVEVVAKELIDLGKEHKLPLWTAEGLFFHGWILAQQSDDKLRGIELMTEGLKNYCDTGTEVVSPCGYAVLAETLGISGRPGEGLEVIRTALKRPYMNLPHPIFYTAELLRVEGDLLAAIGEFEAAEARLTQALRIAHEQKAKSYELRAAISLNKFWRAQRQPARARKVLDGMYEWFSEGFATADLKQAKAQLGRMAAKAHSR